MLNWGKRQRLCTAKSQYRAYFVSLYIQSPSTIYFSSVCVLIWYVHTLWRPEVDNEFLLNCTPLGFSKTRALGPDFSTSTYSGFPLSPRNTHMTSVHIALYLNSRRSNSDPHVWPLPSPTICISDLYAHQKLYCQLGWRIPAETAMPNTI